MDPKAQHGVREALQATALLAAENRQQLAKNGVFQLLGVLLQEGEEATQEEALYTAIALLEGSDVRVGLKTVAGKQLLNPVYNLMASPLSKITIRSCASEALNYLVQGCPANSAFLGKSVSVHDMVNVLESCTDFGLQSVVFEVLYRYSIHHSPRDLKIAFANHPSNCAQLLQDAGDMSDAASFRDATRSFLLTFNSGLGVHQRIFSLRTSDSLEWVDFGAVEMSVGDESESDDSQGAITIIAYKDIAQLRLSDSTMLLTCRDDHKVTLNFATGDTQVLRERICPRIRACMRVTSLDTKMSIVTLPIPSPGSMYSPRSPTPDTSTVPAVPATRNQHLPLLEEQQQQQQQQQQQSEPPFAMPMAPKVFGTPNAKSSQNALAASPSLFGAPPPSPLAQTILDFGSQLEKQLALETSRVRRQGRELMATMQRDFQSLATEQHRQSSERRKRSRQDMDALLEEAGQTLEQSKRAVTEALANVAHTQNVLVQAQVKFMEREMAAERDHEAARIDLFNRFIANLARPNEE